ATDEIGRGVGQPLGHAISTAIFKRKVLAFQIAEIAQSLPESIPHRRVIDDADARNLSLLLRMRRERPCRCAAEHHDELAPLHSITSSARASKVGGISRPAGLNTSGFTRTAIIMAWALAHAKKRTRFRLCRRVIDCAFFVVGERRGFLLLPARLRFGRPGCSSQIGPSSSVGTT